MERTALGVPGGEERGDQGYLFSHVEGEALARDWQGCFGARPRRPHEVRRWLRAPPVEAKDMIPTLDARCKAEEQHGADLREDT